MKRYAICFIALFALLTAVCQAEVAKGSSRAVKLDCPDDFKPFDIVAAPDGTLLLSGYSGPTVYNNRRAKATIINCALDGERLWEFVRQPEEDVTDSYFYRYTDSIYVSEGRIATLFYGFEEGSAIEYIEGEQVAGRIDGLPAAIDGFLPLSDGFLIYGRPDRYSQRIIRINERDEILWQLIWPERMIISGLATNGDAHVAYGYIDVEGPDGLEVPNESVVIAFNDEGRILWRNDIPSIDRFNGCVWTDGKIVLAGTTPENEGKASNGIVAAFDEQGHTLFTREYSYPQEENYWQTGFNYVISADGGYIAFLVSYRLGVCFMYVDREGNLISQWNVPFDGIPYIESADIMYINGELYVTASGDAEHEPLPEDEDGYTIGLDTIPYITVVKRTQPPISEARE